VIKISEEIKFRESLEIHAGVMTVGFEKMAEFLRLPTGIKIESVFMHPHAPFGKRFQVVIKGEGLPLVPEGVLVPEVDVTYETDYEAKVPDYKIVRIEQRKE
jgi:hypothetical protein